ncbi:hypothetical protein [Methanosarcina acetivorans]|uniref:hypothetical protein n=1 Tax=Methanosarcina acetivorans TaxID=2214 RepID=UPI000A2EDF57|nr:hypothetical protein [Methanosarcina acetivorans]
MKLPRATHLIVTADSEETAQEIKDLLKTFLKERGLELSDDKTLITNITEGFDFLGWNFRKYRDKLLIKLLENPYKNLLKKSAKL